MQIYGHRGAKREYMENSLHGFISTQNNGIQYIELDVRLSADNELVVVHDENLKRLANTNLNVSKTDAKTLASIKLINAAEGIPTLRQVVEACPQIKHWQFEVKTLSTNLSFIDPMSTLINDLDLHEKVTITSLHRGILKAFKFALPHIPRGYVQETPVPQGIKTAKKLGCDKLILNKNLANKTYIKKAQKKGLHVSVWTVNDSNLIKRLQGYGVDSLITDIPQTAKSLLATPT